MCSLPLAPPGKPITTIIVKANICWRSTYYGPGIRNKPHYTLQHSQSILLYMGDGRLPPPLKVGTPLVWLLLWSSCWIRLKSDSAEHAPFLSTLSPALTHCYFPFTHRSSQALPPEKRPRSTWAGPLLYCSMCEAQGLTSRLTSPTALPILKTQTFYQNLSLLSSVDLNFPLHYSSLFFCFQK